ncbi:MAG: class D beta-lactamase [bacterium]
MTLRSILFGACISLLICLSACFWQDNAQKSVMPSSMCFIVKDIVSGDIIAKEGDCDTRQTPCSTFKIALSLMGCDAGILKNEREPELPYKQEYNAEFEFWRQAYTPQLWIKNSCIWYSCEITARLGMQKFEKYVRDFNYGNGDVSGELGQNNGLNRAWLCSSLKISPTEQIEFIAKLLNFNLPVSCQAYELTQKLLFVGLLDNGWRLYGKTGAGIFDGELKSVAWYVGWVTQEQKTLIFVCLIYGDIDKNRVNSQLAKEFALNKLKVVCEK